MKFIKSKGGYYYKKYKNGKKKRISKKEYLKHSKKKTTNKTYKIQKKKHMRGGNLETGDIVRVKSDIILDTNTVPYGTLGTVCKNENNSNDVIEFYSNTPKPKPSLTSISESLEKLLTTTFIEDYLEPELKAIVTQSYFWNEWMKPLLELKQIRVKSLKPLKFSSIREPIFTTNPGLNFQNKLFEWWVEVSHGFTNKSQTYCLMKEDITRELINEQPNNTTEHSTDYFYLQFPVMFINRLLQIIEYYSEILSTNNKLPNYSISKENVTNLDKFTEIFAKLDIFGRSNGLYLNLLDVEIVFLQLYEHICNRNITIRLNNSAIKLEIYYRRSYDKKYIYFPTSMDPSEQYMINMYYLPIVVYLAKKIPVHDGIIHHPSSQIVHDIMFHFYYFKVEYHVLSDLPYFQNIFTFRMIFIKNILLFDTKIKSICRDGPLCSMIQDLFEMEPVMEKNTNLSTTEIISLFEFFKSLGEDLTENNDIKQTLDPIYLKIKELIEENKLGDLIILNILNNATLANYIIMYIYLNDKRQKNAQVALNTKTTVKFLKETKVAEAGEAADEVEAAEKMSRTKDRIAQQSAKLQQSLQFSFIYFQLVHETVDYFDNDKISPDALTQAHFCNQNGEPYKIRYNTLLLYKLIHKNDTNSYSYIDNTDFTTQCTTTKLPKYDMTYHPLIFYSMIKNKEYIFKNINYYNKEAPPLFFIKLFVSIYEKSFRSYLDTVQSPIPIPELTIRRQREEELFRLLNESESNTRPFDNKLFLNMPNQVKTNLNNVKRINSVLIDTSLEMFPNTVTPGNENCRIKKKSIRKVSQIFEEGGKKLKEEFKNLEFWFTLCQTVNAHNKSNNTNKTKVSRNNIERNYNPNMIKTYFPNYLFNRNFINDFCEKIFYQITKEEEFKKISIYFQDTLICSQSFYERIPGTKLEFAT